MALGLLLFVFSSVLRCVDLSLPPGRPAFPAVGLTVMPEDCVLIAKQTTG